MIILADQPMHGCQLIQAMTERSGGSWRPGPGTVYPTLTQLEHDGLVTIDDYGGRRPATITSTGRAELAKRLAQRGDPFTDVGAVDGPDLRF